jgi:hypothetical protein
LDPVAAQHKEESMGQALESAQYGKPASNRWTLIAQDIATGFMSTSRLIVTFVGCITLLGAAVVVSNDAARARFADHAPALFTGWLAPISAAADATAISAADATPQPAGASDMVVPEQKNVSRYLARRYRVADEAVRVLVAAAYEVGTEHELDPLLILAVMAVESSMNPFAESAVGAQGLMQVMTRVHTDKFEPHGGDLAALDPVANIKVGSAILKDLIRRGGSVERGLQLYVGAGNLADDGGYGSRVLGERARIEMAASGKVDLALSAGVRSDLTRGDVRPVSLAPDSQAPVIGPTSKAAGVAPKA